MSTSKESIISLKFAEGVTEEVIPDVISGSVTTSENTRLTTAKGSIARAPAITTLSQLDGGAAHECGGIIPSAQDSSIVLLKHGDTVSSKRWSGGVLSDVTSSILNTAGQNAYYNYPVSAAGIVPGSMSQLMEAPVAVDASNRMWFISYRPTTGSSYGTFLTVVDEDGRSVVTSRKILSTVATWIGITPHRTAGEDTAIIHYVSGTDWVTRVLTISGGDVTVGSAVVVQAKDAAGGSSGDVVSQNGTTGFAFMVFQQNATDVRVVRTLQGVFSASVDIAGVVVGGIKSLAISVFSVSGVSYVAVAIRDTTTTVKVYNATTMALVWTVASLGPTTDGRVAIAPYVTALGSCVVVAYDRTFTATFGTGTPMSTRFDFLRLSDGASFGDHTLYWQQLYARAVYHPTGTIIRPYFSLQRCYRTDAVNPTDIGYLADPSVEVYTPFKLISSMTPVMRFGADRCMTPTQVGTAVSGFSREPSNTISCGGNKLTVSYLELRLDIGPDVYNDARMVRYVQYDLASTEQAAFAIGDGSTIIASGLPAYWDGSEVAELCPLHRPVIHLATTGGSGNNLVGDYAFRVMFVWRDNNGLARRSSPSLPASATFAGTAPIIYVPVPDTMRNRISQESIDVVLYATLPSGSIYYAQIETLDWATAGYVKFDSILTPTTAGGRMYSTGADNEPLTAEAPPPALDVCVAGQRAWMIDAENRQRIVYSKPKEPGIEYEFNLALEILLPTSLGKAVALEAMGRTPYIFTDKAVCTIAGYGPDAFGLGSFSDPDVIINRGCYSREAVCKLPDGSILFQLENKRFALIGSGFQEFEDFGTYSVGTPVVHSLQHEVCYPLSDGTGWVVYNWLQQGWTKWTTGISSSPITASTQLMDASAVTTSLLYAPAVGTLSTMVSNSESTTAATRIVRGWIAPEGMYGDCVIREIWVNGLTKTHDLTIKVYFDFDDTNFITRTWTSTELSNLSTDGRYCVAVNLHSKNSRAVKVEVSDSGAQGMRPLNMDVVYGANMGGRRRTLRNGALK